MKPVKFILIFTLCHLFVSSSIMFVSFCLTMEMSGERDMGIVHSQATKNFDRVTYNLANILMSPAYFLYEKHYSKIDKFLPGPWNWILVPINSLLWAIMTFLIIIGCRKIKKKVQPKAIQRT